MIKYQFNNEGYYNLLSEYFPILYLNNELTEGNFNNHQIENLLEKAIEIVNHPIMTEEEESVDEKETITCFTDEVNQVFNELLKIDGLMLYGHGGAGKAIMDTEFHCHYANLGSHFLPLSKNNQSLSQLKAWPHMGCQQVAILALNQHELQPIYREREKENTYDTDVYSIPKEYFVGYYDASDEKFYYNEEFKARHEYDPSCTIYPIESMQTCAFFDGPEEARDIYADLDLINKILFFSSKFSLDELGYEQTKKQIQHLINQIREKSFNLTPELFEQYRNSKVNQKNEELEKMMEDMEWVDWDDELEDDFSK